MADAVQETEERYRLLVEAAHDMVFTLGPDGTFTSLNAAFEAITGWKREDWIGKPFPPLIHPDDLAAAVDRSVRLLRGENLPPFEVRIRTRSGGWRTVESASAPQVKDGTVVQILGIVRDITERKQKEEEGRRMQAFLDSVVENIPHMVFVKEAEDLRFVRFNRAGEELLGMSRDELIGRNDYDFFPKEEADFFTGKDREVLERGRLLDIAEEPIETRHGQVDAPPLGLLY